MSAADSRRFTYHGPPVFSAVVGEVRDGDEVEGPAALEASYGFTPVSAAPSRPQRDEDGD